MSSSFCRSVFILVFMYIISDYIVLLYAIQDLQRRSIFIFSHSLQVHRIYLSIFFLSFFFFPKNQEFSIIEWNNCSGENSLQAPKVKEKSSVKNTRLFLKPTSSFAFKCCSEAVVLINLVRAGSFVGYMDFLCSMSQYIFL